MDGTTEPIIAVIGHPIAGNPTQFAIEMALRSLHLDWRVLSFDVQPADIATALDGFSVTGIVGVIIDPSVRDEASSWFAGKSDESTAAEATTNLHDTWDDTEPPGTEADENEIPSGPDPIDCLHRDSEANFVASYEQRDWLDGTIAEHAGENRIWLGTTLDNLPLRRDILAKDPTPLPPDPEVIGAANLIVLAESGDASLEAEDWPSNNGSTLIIDLTSGHADQLTMQQLGYRVVTEMDRRIGTLQRCLQRWTGEQVSTDVIHDAIEEYLGV